MDTETLKVIVDCLRSTSNETFDATTSIALDELADRIDAVIEEEQHRRAHLTTAEADYEKQNPRG